GIRPSEPTSTGTATIRDTCDSVSSPMIPLSRNTGPSWLSSDQAQKFTANPIVARISINQGEGVRRVSGVRGSRLGGSVAGIGTGSFCWEQHHHVLTRTALPEGTASHSGRRQPLQRHPACCPPG